MPFLCPAAGSVQDREIFCEVIRSAVMNRGGPLGATGTIRKEPNQSSESQCVCPEPY